MHLITTILNKRAKGFWIAKLILPILPLFVVFSNVSYSQEIVRPALRDRPSLSIDVHQIQRSFTASFDIDVILTNLTNKSIDIREVKILLPESMKSIRSNKIKETFDAPIHQLKEGSERIYRWGIPRAQMPLLKSLYDVETLLFLPGTYVIRSEVVFSESGSSAHQSMYATYELNLEPPLSAVLRGGVLGALLLAFFVPAYRVIQAKGQRKIPIKDILSQSLVFFMAGSVVSITAILLLHRLGSLNLPITIVVNDYLGGVVVGLFSYTIGNTLYRQFFGIKSNSAK